MDSKGTSTGTHDNPCFLPPNIKVSCRFSLKSISGNVKISPSFQSFEPVSRFGKNKAKSKKKHETMKLSSNMDHSRDSEGRPDSSKTVRTLQTIWQNDGWMMVLICSNRPTSAAIGPWEDIFPTITSSPIHLQGNHLEEGIILRLEWEACEACETWQVKMQM